MANPLAPVTLTANVVEEFTLDGHYDSVEVSSDGAEKVFFRTDGEDPEVGTGDGVTAAGCQWIPSAGALTVSGFQSSVIKVISSGTPMVGVRGV